MRLSEIYSKQNGEFYDYMIKNDMLDGKFNPNDFDEEIVKWFEHAYEDEIDFVNREYNTNFESFDELRNNPKLAVDLYGKLSERAKKACKEWCENYMLRHTPGSTPTYMHLSVLGAKLSSDEWLVHFSDNAKSIQDHGFTRGVVDMTRLGLTNHLPEFAKENPGYNFAFIADARDAINASKRKYTKRTGTARYGAPVVKALKYGNDAVLFQSSGVSCYHLGDNERQIVFYGPSIKPQNIVYLHNNNDVWEVIARGGNRAGTAIYRDADFEKVVRWVENNYQQYRNVL